MKPWLTLLIWLTTVNASAGINFQFTRPASSPVTVLDSGVIIKHSPGLIPRFSFMDLYGNKTTPMGQGWSIISTALDVVEDILNIKLLSQVKRISDMYPDRQIFVIDWGCGDGRAINALAKQAQRIGIKNVKFIGFGNLFFRRWKFAQNSEFIFDKMENLHKYLGKKSVGLIYSHFGLYHVSSDAISKHLNELAPYMLNQGLVITNVTERKIDIFINSTPYYTADEDFTAHNNVIRLTRKGVGSTVYSSAVTVEGL